MPIEPVTAFKRLAKNCIGVTCGKSADQLSVERLEQADIISFDVFDTLVTRACSNPELVFDLVERRHNARCPQNAIHGFKEARMAAESAARSLSNRQEPNLSEIYGQFDGEYASAAAELLELEIDSELSLCSRNDEMKAVYDRALSLGKHVIITSDMYLSANDIARILANCGYSGYEKIYVSSEQGVTKRGGKLFSQILNDTNVPADKMLHIGDHPLSDYIVPKKQGIRSFLYRRRNLQPTKLFRSTSFTRKNEDALARDILGQLVHDGLSEHSDDVRNWMGYAVLGPLLVGFATWLQTAYIFYDQPPLWFLSREGHLIMQAWHILYGTKANARYLSISRAAACKSVAAKAQNYEELFSIMACLLGGCKTVGEFLRIAGVESNFDDAAEYGLDPLAPLTDADQDALFAYVQNHCHAYYAQQHEYLSAYLKQNIENDPLSSDKRPPALICDIGWSGTMQSMLQHMMPSNELIGLYLGVSDFFDTLTDLGNRIVLDRRGYWCKAEEWKTRGQVIRFTNSALETLFLNSEGTTIGYELHNDNVVPVKDTSDQPFENARSIDMLHKSALAFVSRCSESNVPELLGTINSETAMLPYLNTVVRPKTQALEFYSHFRFVDGIKSSTLLPSHNLAYYLTHPKDAFEEFSLNNSKIIWLKGVFKLPLPYYELLRFLTDGVGLKSSFTQSVEGGGSHVA